MTTVENSSTAYIPNPENSSKNLFHEIIDFALYWELAVAAIGIPLNLFAIFIWSKKQAINNNQKNTTRSWFLFSFLLADLLFASCHPIMIFGRRMGFLISTSSNTSCLLIFGAASLSSTASHGTLFCINLEALLSSRRLSLLVNNQSRIRTTVITTAIPSESTTFVFAVFAWLIGFVWSSFLLSGPFTERHQDNQCRLSYERGAFSLSLLSFATLAPLSAFLVFSILSVRIILLTKKEIPLNRDLIADNNQQIHDLTADADQDQDQQNKDLPEEKVDEEMGKINNFPVNSNQITRENLIFALILTIWTLVTYGPYRISFFVYLISRRIDFVWQNVLFALRTICVIGDPIIVIFALPDHKRRSIGYLKKFDFRRRFK